MSTLVFRPLLALCLVAGLAGCGDAEPAAPPTGTTTAARPALLRETSARGEVVVDGEASPATHGPYDLRGRYRVRFVQYAPEDPRLDFSQQTSFVATLSTSPRAAPVPLFRASARSGVRTIELDGRYRVEVAFGDFPYVIRFTPARG